MYFYTSFPLNTLITENQYWLTKRQTTKTIMYNPLKNHFNLMLDIWNLKLWNRIELRERAVNQNVWFIILSKDSKMYQNLVNEKNVTVI